MADTEFLDPVRAAWACRQRLATVQKDYYAAVSRDFALHRGDRCSHTGDAEECRNVRAILAVREVLAPTASEMGGWFKHFGFDPQPLEDLTVAAIVGTSRQIDDAMLAAGGALARFVHELRARKEREKSVLLESLATLAAERRSADSAPPVADTTPASTGPAGTPDPEHAAPSKSPGTEANPLTVYVSIDGRALRLGDKELTYRKGKDWLRITPRGAEGRLLLFLCRPRGVMPHASRAAVSRLRSALAHASAGTVRIDRTAGGLSLSRSLVLAMPESESPR